jgi:hypothetical protein
MKKLVFMFLMMCFGIYANTDTRTWTFKDGESFKASLIAYDKEKGVVKLKNDDVTEVDYAYDDLAPLDQEWIKKWRKIQDEMTIALVRVGGDFSHSQTLGDLAIDYYVYYPSKYLKSSKPLPLMILFSPSGKGQRLLKRHIEAAEKVGFILVSADVFRNNAPFDELDPAFEALLETVKDTVEFDPRALFMGGSSGGGALAYHYSAKFNEPWAGIYSNGGWLGGKKYYDLAFPWGMRVAMLNGHKDNAANNWVGRDTEVLEKRLALVKLFPFEGGHQLADVPTQIKAFTWLLEGSQFYEGFTKDKELLFDTHFIEDQQLIVSSKKAFKAANRIFTQIDFVGLSKEDVIDLLGAPEKMNSFAEAADEVAENTLVYVLHDGAKEERWVFELEHDLVTGLQDKR